MDKSEFYRTGNVKIAESNAKFHDLMADGKITMPDLREETIRLYRQEQADNITAMNDQYEDDLAEAKVPTEATDCRIAEIDTEIAELTRFDKEWLSQLGMIAMRYEAAKDIPVVNHNVDIASLMAERSRLENEREISLEDNEHLFIAWNIPTATTDNGRQFDLP